MNMQRKIIVTVTYNDLGCIIDTKAEPYEESTFNQLATDCISRQDAIDMLEMYPFTEYGDYEAAREVINHLPSAQPEIIRCKDCKHYYFADNRVLSEQSWVCDAWGADQTAHMGYCFKAERKNNG